MAGSYRLDRIGWIVCIVSAGLYRLACIGWILLDGSYRMYRISIGLGFAKRNWLLFDGWFATGWMVTMDWMERWWYGGGM